MNRVIELNVSYKEMDFETRCMVRSVMEELIIELMTLEEKQRFRVEDPESMIRVFRCWQWFGASVAELLARRRGN